MKEKYKRIIDFFANRNISFFTIILHANFNKLVISFSLTRFYVCLIDIKMINCRDITNTLSEENCRNSLLLVLNLFLTCYISKVVDNRLKQ